MDKEYNTIKKFYGQRVAERSQVPLMNHIIEGLQILDNMNASNLAKSAYCLHPIVQNGEDVDVTWSDAYELACEYRDRANSYLCRPQNDWIKDTSKLYEIVGEMSEDCRHMLIADKLQNFKDFIVYHMNSHPRSKQLTNYFIIWLAYLNK